MAANPFTTTSSFFRELRQVIVCAGKMWRVVPREHRLALFLACGIMFLSGVASIGVPVLLGRLLDAMQRSNEAGTPRDVIFRTAFLFLGAIAGMVFLREMLNVLRRFLVENTCTRVDKYLSVTIVSHLMAIDLAHLTHEKLGALHGRIFRGVEGTIRLMRIGFLDFIPALLTGVLAITAALCKQPWLALAMLAVIPVSISITAWQLVSQKGIRLELMRSREGLDATIVEQLTGLDYVRVANTYPHEVRRIATAAENRRVKELRHHVAMSFFGSSKALTEGFFHVLVLALAVYLALEGKASFGDVLTFSGLFMSVMTPLAEIHRVVDEGHEASLRFQDLQNLLNLPVDQSLEPRTRVEPTIDHSAPIVAMRDLRLMYRLPNGKSRTALNGVSLEIQRGETIGVAGRSGSGKSTWLKVLTRLVHPQAGQAWLMGTPLEDVSREMIGKMIGYVGQSPFIFSGTIAENIAYGVGDQPPTMEEIRHAAQRACIHDEILAMPEGYDSIVAERGQNLSGGQKQRIALARVLLKNPAILILDEATSALDTISERKVQQAIAAARQDRTVIMVAHRLSTFADADRILVFDEGRIVETGTFDELLRHRGVFAELVKSSELNFRTPVLQPQPALV